MESLGKQGTFRSTFAYLFIGKFGYRTGGKKYHVTARRTPVDYSVWLEIGDIWLKGTR